MAAPVIEAGGATVSEGELRVDYASGGQVRLYGADNANTLRGLYLDGVVLDEYADMDPRVWPEVIRPGHRPGHCSDHWPDARSDRRGREPPRRRRHAWRARGDERQAGWTDADDGLEQHAQRGPNLYPNWPYDPVTGITPISNIQVVPFALVVNKDSPFKSVADLRASAKEKPGTITQANAGIGSSNHLVSELFQIITGAKFVLVPCRGGGPAMNDLIAGQVATYFDQASTSVPHVNSGTIRALAVTASRRMPTLPDVPTFAELGIKGFEVLNVTGLVGPGGMDPALAARLQAAAAKALEDPQVKAHFARPGVQVVGDKPEEFAAFLRADLARWKKVVTEANIKLQ